MKRFEGAAADALLKKLRPVPNPCRLDILSSPEGAVFLRTHRISGSRVISIQLTLLERLTCKNLQKNRETE